MDYNNTNRLACELHLDATVTDEEALKAIDAFLAESEAEAPPRLFVWVSRDDEVVKASTTTLEGSTLGALAFLHPSSGQQLQCMTLQPRTYPDEEKKDDGEKEEEKKGTQHGTTGSTLEALQLYARHCFVPAVQSLSTEEEETSSRLLAGLEDKLRELDVALGQCRRSALSQIPQVRLMVNPAIEKAAKVAEASGKALTDLEGLGLGDKLHDDEFLNEIQSGVSQWIVQIRKVTVLPTTTAFPSVDSSNAADLEEVSFWLQLEEALQTIPNELKRPEVELTLNLLKAAKRFLATIALDNNTGLEQALSHTQDIAHYVRQYPATQLEAARDWDKMSTAVNAVFDHLPKIRSSRYYDLERCAKLMEATTLTLRRRILEVLKEGPNIIFMEYGVYESSIRYPSQDVFVQFDDRYDEFKEFFLEQGRRRRIASGKTASQVMNGLTLYHTPVKERLDILHEFRQSHEKLLSVLKEVLEEEDGSAIREVESAPRNIFASLDILDLSPGGSAALEQALEQFDRQMDALEERLAKLLRDKLTACSDAEACFSVFARFNPLLTRTRVRAAVKEFQIQLIATVTQAVEQLQSKFTLKYEASPAARISRLRGIPPGESKSAIDCAFKYLLYTLANTCTHNQSPVRSCGRSRWSVRFTL